MTTPAKGGAVTYQRTLDGDHAIGVKLDGQFVPFATLSDARVAQLVENAANRGETVTTDDDGEGS